MVRVVSWNIELGRDIAGAVEALTTRPELASFDVLLLQEMSPEGVEEIAAAFDAASVYAATGTHPKTGRPFGNAVVSRHEVAAHRSLELPHRALVAGFSRGAIGAQIEVSGEPTWFYSAHTEIPGIRARHRRRQFSELAAAAGSLETPALVGGDFNTTWASIGRDLHTAMGAQRFEPSLAGRPTTLRRFGRGFHLDHLFTRRLRVSESGVSAAHTASDHYAIYAELEPRS